MSSLSSSVAIPGEFGTGNLGAWGSVRGTPGISGPLRFPRSPTNPCGFVHPDSSCCPGSCSRSASELLVMVCSGKSATRTSEEALPGRSLGVEEVPRSGSHWPLEEADRGEETRLARSESVGGKDAGSEATEEDGRWDPEEFPLPAAAALGIAWSRALRLIPNSRLSTVRGDEVK